MRPRIPNLHRNPLKHFGLRRELPASDHRPGSSFGWVGGLILIVLGVVFMLQSAGIMVGNWWTIFIFIPALVSAARISGSGCAPY